MQLIIKSLSKTYPNGVQALRNIDLTIENGMFGLLGPNGAGKSTLMRTLATLQDVDSGSAFLDDIDILNQKQEIRKVLGYLPQEFGVYPKVSSEQMLNHLAVLKGIMNKKERKDIVESLLNQVNLFAVKNKSLDSYSGGMKQRFGIAQALLGNPKLIIVDEPTAGLDPAERVRFNNLLSEIGENIVVILSTHIVDDVSELCKDMAIINRGEVLVKGNPKSIIEELNNKVWQKIIKKEQLENYQQEHHVISSKLSSGDLNIHVMSDIKPDNSFNQVIPDLEDVYFSKINATQKAVNHV